MTSTDHATWPNMDEESDKEDELPRRTVPSTLLPSSLASFVSLATTTTSISLQAAGFLGKLVIGAARTGTLTSFEVTRVVFEGILSRAGQDVSASSIGGDAQVAADGLLERAVSTPCSKPVLPPAF